MGNRPLVIGKLVHNPVNQLSQGSPLTARQASPMVVSIVRAQSCGRFWWSECIRQTVRCADEIHVAGLPLAVAHLAISKPQLLLPVPMKGLGACPAVSIHQHHAYYFPPSRLLTKALLASASSRSFQNSTIRTGCFTSGIRICLLKYQDLRLPTRTGFFACQGIWRATACRTALVPHTPPSG